jgi:hypothetical protein
MIQQATLETALKNRRLNTTKVYNRPQKLWKEFCTKFDFEDKEFVSTAKLLFTQQVVLELTVQPQRQRKAKGKGKRKAAEVEEEDSASSGDDIDKEKLFEVAADVIDDGPPGTPLKHNTAKTYISGIMDLYNQQVARGIIPTLILVVLASAVI